KHDIHFYRNLWKTVLAGDIFRGEMTNRRKDGSLYLEENTITPVRDSGGRITHFISVKQDISREREMENHLRQAQKMEAIGTLAGGIAHDFNNILGGIIGYANLALMDCKGNQEAVESINQILHGGERAKQLVAQILTFSRQQKHEMRPLPLQLLVGDALKLLRSTLPTTIEIISRIEGAIPPVLADPTQIHQVVMNLCTNSAHAMKGRAGRLEVALDSVHVDDPAAYPGVSLTPGHHAVLTVSDTGHGMDASTIKRIFEPYFTTKDPWEGTGLGLAVVHGIVQEHAGAIQVESEPGSGTIFRIYFPAWETPIVSAEPPAAQEPVRGNGQSILVIDDEPAIAKTVARLLEHLGYVVMSETDPRSALALFRKEPNKFDLILTDLTMPGMTGVELAVQMLQIRPHLPILLTTGFGGSWDREPLHGLGILEMIHKRAPPLTLAKALSEALAATRPAAPPQTPEIYTNE